MPSMLQQQNFKKEGAKYITIVFAYGVLVCLCKAPWNQTHGAHDFDHRRPLKILTGKDIHEIYNKNVCVQIDL